VRVIVAWLCACARHRRIGRHQNSFNRITEDTAQHDRFRCPIAFHRQCSGPQTRQACQHCHENCGSASADLQETDKDISTSLFSCHPIVHHDSFSQYWPCQRGDSSNCPPSRSWCTCAALYDRPSVFLRLTPYGLHNVPDFFFGDFSRAEKYDLFQSRPFTQTGCF
jgi:hypothetical protein